MVPSGDRRSRASRRTYVVDTSVLLADPDSLTRFDGHGVVLPVVVIDELEGKRHHPELGWAARRVLRALEQLRQAQADLAVPVVVNDAGGTVRIEMNHADLAGLPDALRGPSNDHRILAVARNLELEGHDVVVVSKDLPLRLRASLVGLSAEEYRSELAHDGAWSGFVELPVPADVVDRLFDERVVDIDDAADLPCNTGLSLVAGSQSALGRVHPDKAVRLVRGDRTLFGLRGRSAEQRVAIDLLADPDVGIVSLGGRAGTGKSVLALAAGLDAVLESRTQRRLMVFRPLYAVGGQDLGYLPGSESEKMEPWASATYDALDDVAGPEILAELQARRLLDVLPLTHIRGRNLTDTFVIIEEAQNLERNVLLTALSRLGQGSSVVLTHDVAQRDNLRVGRYDGIASVIDSLRGSPLFGHVTLARSERSPIAALVSEVLEGP